MATITVKLHFFPSDTTQNRPEYPDGNTIRPGDNVVFEQVGSTLVHNVDFPDGNCFGVSSNTVATLGGASAYSSPPLTVTSSLSSPGYRFTTTQPGKENDGTVEGELEVSTEPDDKEKKNPRP
jgi:plastocyanin